MAAAEDNTTEEYSLLRREARAAREPFRLLAAAMRLRRAPKGSLGIMVLPGFSTNDKIMFPLRSYLRSRGHTVWGWNLGVNRGEIDANLHRVVAQVERRVADNNDKPIVLVGWSLGGVFAREVARTRPELVDRLITLASPAQSYSRAAGDPAAHRIDAAITAFYSKRDGVVGWRGVIDELNPHVTMIEVNSSHLGITLDPTAWLAIAQELGARPAGN